MHKPCWICWRVGRMNKAPVILPDLTRRRAYSKSCNITFLEVKSVSRLKAQQTWNVFAEPKHICSVAISLSEHLLEWRIETFQIAPLQSRSDSNHFSSLWVWIMNPVCYQYVVGWLWKSQPPSDFKWLQVYIYIQRRFIYSIYLNLLQE